VFAGGQVRSASASPFSWESIRAKAARDPLVFGFLALTVAALTRGLGAMLANDKRGSQRMMRARVGFQLAALGALVGGVYYRGLQQALAAPAPAAAAPAAPAAAEGTPAPTSPVPAYPAVTSLLASLWAAPPTPPAAPPAHEPRAPLR